MGSEEDGRVEKHSSKEEGSIEILDFEDRQATMSN